MFILNAASELNLKQKRYQKALELYIWNAYLQDTDQGDLTTELFLKDTKQSIKATITTRQGGILAGLQEAQWFLKKVGISIGTTAKDGQLVAENSVIMTLSGPADKLLGAERTLLNLLQRMSGIATYTAAFHKKTTGDVQLLATRKTLWGPLDKRAVSLGGGGTHRLHLGDAVLIKDNHLSLQKESWLDRLAEVMLEAEESRFIEIEVDTLEMAQQILDFCHSLPEEEKRKLVVMLDNFTPEQAKAWAPALAKTGVLVEVSGGITLENVSGYMHPGVSAVSTSRLTMQAHALDMSLHLM